MIRHRQSAAVLALWALALCPLRAEPVRGQVAGGTPTGDLPSDAFVDATAARLHAAAVANWEYIDETVRRYTAVVKERMAVSLRTPLKDRTLYRHESASRVFWDRDRRSIIQVLAHREQTPAGVEAPSPAGPSGAMGDVFDPAGDRLLFGMSKTEDLGDAGDDDFWFEHPLAPDATLHYRFRSGDTLTLSLADGRAFRAVELQVLPREADVHRITGSLWIEPESGALVRAAYRLADRFDAFRDIPDLREEEDEGLRYVPGFFKPWTMELGLLVVDYGLWDFEVWLPRSFRIEGVIAAGILKAPLTFDASYSVESVVTENDLAREMAGEPAAGVLEERRFASREEAMRFLAGLIEGEEGTGYEPPLGWEESFELSRDDRNVRYLVPTDLERLHDGPHLPPPIWDDAPGFPTDDEIRAVEDLLADLPRPSPAQTSRAFNWGLERPDLVRYNRVEGLALGGRFQLRTGSPFGPVSLSAEPFFGVADLEPKLRLSAEWETLRRRTTLAAYRNLQPVARRGDHLGFGNSVTGLLFGRDDGEYFLAEGGELVITPPSAERESWRLRLYGERHRSVARETDFTLAHAFDDAWSFRENIEASEHDEIGAEVVWSPWWGTDPLRPQFGGEVYVHGATGDLDYGRASLMLRTALPFKGPDGGSWRFGLELEGGESWGEEVPVQRHWFLGSSTTLRGYDASTLGGPAFTRVRAELARGLPAFSLALFGDGGWAGAELEDFMTADALFSVGIGVSGLDGLVRFDVARGLREPEGTRVDFYLDAAF